MQMKASQYHTEVSTDVHTTGSLAAEGTRSWHNCTLADLRAHGRHRWRRANVEVESFQRIF